MTCHYPDLGSDESSVWNFCARLLEHRLLNASKFMSSQRTIFCHCCLAFFCLLCEVHAVFLLKYFIYWLCLVSWPMQCNILCNTGIAWSLWGSCCISTKIFYLLAMFSFTTYAMQYFVQHRHCMISAWSQTVPLVNVNEIHIQTPKGELQLLSYLP